MSLQPAVTQIGTSLQTCLSRVLLCCSLAKAPSLTETRSLTTLTPLYGEDVMYCLEAEEAAKNLKLGGSDPAAAARGMTDLLTPPGLGSSSWEQQGAVTLLTYLRGVYPSDWDNFRERIARLALAAADAATKAANGDGEPDSKVPAGVKPERIKSHLKRGFRAIHDYDFRAGGVLAPWALELQLWASFRAQVSRTAHTGSLRYSQPRCAHCNQAVLPVRSPARPLLVTSMLSLIACLLGACCPLLAGAGKDSPRHGVLRPRDQGADSAGAPAPSGHVLAGLPGLGAADERDQVQLPGGGTGAMMAAGLMSTTSVTHFFAPVCSPLAELLQA